ncbi:transcriptional regulator GutM [Bombilactobacillus folatiphilus]|uniref:Transcriptional regulator GutM n=1 Tax=Bombilactobacillus folatiphilus TaxID=2923362 RepID=A0ABY4P8J0_9LACO|nr:transcriptional regulator GutM [Bombilactobacillus folatiphilus]UQS81910.1 transcriptional regulator GutM [Bombilactobacillus folatiphilus]
MMIMFGLIFVGAFLLQGLLGFFQIKNFSMNYRLLRKQGQRVLIGKNPKKIRSGTLLLLAMNESGQIQDAKLMKGVTVFAKFKDLTSLRNQNLAMVATDYDSLHQYDTLTRQCIQNAYKNYVDFQTGQLASSEYDTQINVFALPMFVQLRSWVAKLKQKI